ncbi:MAG: hypothetical protein A2Y10_19625 [Planctomycetes bacterium GWF2_41_51]|nr:MAG: hypothetical protein A2Y10_19625 [Planctomycetes bacterium GWF2_41_51]HBG28190.1 hypothetical protein [Phycisphaerales bacterium]
MKKILFIILLFAGWSYAVTGDFGSSGGVEANDVNTFCSYWLDSPVADPNCDFNEDGNVNFVDFALMAGGYVGGSLPAPEPERYTLTIVSATNGSVMITPDELDYIQGSEVILMAVPGSGYAFQSWNGDLAGSTNPATIVMDANKDVNAVFISLVPDINEAAIAEPCTPVFEDCYIDLSLGVTNDDNTEQLQYVITSLPSNGILVATPEYADFITSSMLPYTIPEYSSTIVGRFFTTGHKTFDYKGFDGTYYSNTATMDVNVVANSADSLTFTGNEIVTINDSLDTMDVFSGVGICFYFRTMQATCGLFYKRTGSGPGYYACIENGRFGFYLIQPNGVAIGYGRTDAYRVDDGRWHAFGFSRKDGNVSVFGTMVDGDGWEYSNSYLNQPIADYTNSAPVIIGQVPGKPNFIGEFDRLRFYDGCEGASLDLKLLFVVGYPPEPREQSADAVGFSPVVPIVRFMFDEGSGTSIADDKHTPTITGDVDSIQWLEAKGNEDVVIPSRFSPVKRIKRSSTILTDEDCIKQNR